MYREGFYEMLEELDLGEEELAAYFEKVVTLAIEKGTADAFFNMIADFPLIVGANGAKIVVNYEVYGGDDLDILCSGRTSFEAGEDILNRLEEDSEDFYDDEDELEEFEVIGEFDADLIEGMTDEEIADFVKDVFFGEHKNSEDLN